MQSNDAFESFIEGLKLQCEAMMEALRPPTDDELSQKIAAMPDDLVEGVSRYGSERGRKLAKIEMKKRKPAPDTLFQKISNLFK